MKIAYRISEQDYIDARNLFVANEKPWYRRYIRLPWPGVFILVAVLVYLVVVRNRDFGLVGAGCFLGLSFLYCWFALHRFFRRLYQKDRRYKHEFAADISDQGIHFVSPFADSHIKWTSYVRFLESNTIFMLFSAEWLFSIYPKRAFAPGEEEQFRLLLQRNIAPPASTA